MKLKNFKNHFYHTHILILEVEEDVKTFVNAVAAACASFLGVAAVGIFITRKLQKKKKLNDFTILEHHQIKIETHP